MVTALGSRELALVIALICEATDTFWALCLALPLAKWKDIPALIILGIGALFYIQETPWSHCMWHVMAGTALYVLQRMRAWKIIETVEKPDKLEPDKMEEYL